MSIPIDEGVSMNENGDETHSPTGQDPMDVNITSSSLSTLVKSEEVAQQIRAVTDPLSKQLELLCALMKNHRQGPVKWNEETSGLAQGSSRAPTTRSDNCRE